MSEPKQYCKKSVVIEAMQLATGNITAAAEWCNGTVEDAAPSGTVYAPGVLRIRTLEGDHWAAFGDFIIRGVQGEFYPCKPDIFATTYEEVLAPPAESTNEGGD